MLSKFSANFFTEFLKIYFAQKAHQRGPSNNCPTMYHASPQKKKFDY